MSKKTPKAKAKVPTVTLEGTQASRAEAGLSRWTVQLGTRVATIVHIHNDRQRKKAHQGAFYRVTTVSGGSSDVADKDFSAALAKANEMLGVTP